MAEVYNHITYKSNRIVNRNYLSMDETDKNQLIDQFVGIAGKWLAGFGQLSCVLRFILICVLFFKKLVGVEKERATFFLESSNWNFEV